MISIWCTKRGQYRRHSVTGACAKVEQHSRDIGGVFVYYPTGCARVCEDVRLGLNCFMGDTCRGHLWLCRGTLDMPPSPWLIEYIPLRSASKNVKYYLDGRKYHSISTVSEVLLNTLSLCPVYLGPSHELNLCLLLPASTKIAYLSRSSIIKRIIWI